MSILPITPEEKTTKTQIEQVEQKKNEYKLIGHMRKHRGHILFSFNLKTMEIKKARTVTKAILDPIAKKMINKEEIQVEQDCIYYQALNEKNFIKKLVKLGILIPK